jgi:hypothetical protein
MSIPETITIQSWFGRIKRPSGEALAQHRPHGKVRGRRGYYRSLTRQAENFRIDPRGWYDYMHWHADWPGMGNLAWRERREHLNALLQCFAAFSLKRHHGQHRIRFGYTLTLRTRPKTPCIYTQRIQTRRISRIPSQVSAGMPRYPKGFAFS